MKKLLLLLTFLSFVSVSSFADAGTDWRNNQLHQLEKITVGPWDNFGTTLSEQSDEIIYTRDKNQILSLVKHNIKTGESENLTFADGDIKQPTFNQKRNTLAFTYFGNDAQGDVCIFRFEKDVVECLSSNSGVEQSPFWLSDTKVGYLKRKPDSFLWQLVIHDLITSQSKVIAEGNISAPTSSNDGEYVLFNDKTGGEQILRLYQVSTGTETIMPDVDLPGDIGFTAFSTKDEYVYFSYYLNDTNADQAINADDNSVVFRMPFQKWKNYGVKKNIVSEVASEAVSEVESITTSASGIYPEQLTSVDFNCKFPNPGLFHLYLTCAFEGSLDVYRLPLSGMVASHWQKKELDEAHLVARSYEQRLLLLNAKRYRSQSVSVDLLQRFIGNHIQIGEITAARYYISQLLSYYKKQGETDKTAQIFYSALDSLLFLRSEKHKYKNDIVTIPFQRLTQTIRKKMSDISGVSKQALAIKMLAFAFIESELGNDELALKHLKSANLSQFPLEIQKYLYISLFEQAGSGSAYSAQLLRLYPVLFNDMDMSYSFRLFYAFKYLSIEKGDSHVGSGYLIDDVKDDQLKPLFIVDEKSRAIVSAKEDKEKVGVYKSLSIIIKANDDNVLLRKAMHVRAIQIFLENDEYEYMELLSRHWLTVSRVSEMEFVNVATQYAKVSMDKAYGFINQNEPVRAFNTFYPVIRQTNDLEAYYQYLTIGLDKRTKQKDKLEKNLETLKKKKMLGEQEKYVDALRLLIESVDSESKSAKPNNKVLDEALAKLQSINSNEPGSAMHELLLGYIYHRKMQVTQSGYVYDKRLYQNAHYHYLMAIDFAQENARISATVWQNLGWLHKSVGQYALAANYFQQREQYPFLTAESEQSLRWALASTYFYNNQSSQALEQIELVLKHVDASVMDGSSALAFKEKAAFYAMQAEKYELAKKYYEEIFSNAGQIEKLNSSKMRLAYAYTLSKLNLRADAIAQFKMVLADADKLKTLAPTNLRLVAFNPARQKMLANGFLSTLSESFLDKETYLKNRIAVLQGLKGGKDNHFDESSRLTFLIKDYQKLALLYETNSKPGKMIDAINKSIDLAVEWVKLSGDSVGPVIYRATINYMSLEISNPNVFKQGVNKKIAEIYRELHKGFSDYPYPTPVIHFQLAKLNILWQAMQRDVYNAGVFEGDAIAADEKVTALEKSAPDKYKELQNLVNYFKGKSNPSSTHLDR